MGVVIFMIIYAILSISTGEDVGEGVFLIIMMTIAFLFGWFVIGNIKDDNDTKRRITFTI